MAYDATKMADWQIAEAAEGHMKSIWQLQEEMGLKKDELIPAGRIGRLDFMKIIDRLKDKPDGKYVEVTAITPTPLGRGQDDHIHGPYRGSGEEGKERRRRHPSAFGRPDHEHQGKRGGGGNCPGHPSVGVLPRAHGRHQQHHERPQPRHGGPHVADAAREELLGRRASRRGT